MAGLKSREKISHERRRQGDTSVKLCAVIEYMVIIHWIVPPLDTWKPSLDTWKPPLDTLDSVMGYIDGRGIQWRYPIVYFGQFPKYPIAVSHVSHQSIQWRSSMYPMVENIVSIPSVHPMVCNGRRTIPWWYLMTKYRMEVSHDVPFSPKLSHGGIPWRFYVSHGEYAMIVSH